MEAPIQGFSFSRYVGGRDYNLDGVSLPEGSARESFFYGAGQSRSANSFPAS